MRASECRFNMVQLVIVAHAPLASALQQVAAHAYPEWVERVSAVDVQPQDTPESVETRIRAVLLLGEETLLLADIFGATPCNGALRAADGVKTRVICGANVPMLWRALCYGNEPLDKLAGMALSGASHGILQLSSTRPQNQSQKGTADAAGESQDQ